MATPLDENEEIFTEYYDILNKAKELPKKGEQNSRIVLIEYMKLTESYEKLLKTAVRISRMGDKAQKKLLKFKELMDTLRNIE
jgi:hypothetical protein